MIGVGTRFRKSKKVLPGVKLNVGKKSVGVSIGGKLGGVSINSKGDVTKRVSAPGTGFSYVQRDTAKKRTAEKAFCGQCGSPISNGAKFCGHCGSKLNG